MYIYRLFTPTSDSGIWSWALDQDSLGCGFPEAEQVNEMVVSFFTTTCPFRGWVTMRGGTEWEAGGGRQKITH